MIRTSRVRFAALVSTLVFWGLAALPAGLVLCIAEGDHVAIESALELEPCGAPIEHQGRAGEAAFADLCTDTPLLQAMLAKSSDSRIVSLPCSSASIGSSWLPAATLVRAPDWGAAQRGELRALRTIVLRA